MTIKFTRSTKQRQILGVGGGVGVEIRTNRGKVDGKGSGNYLETPSGSRTNLLLWSRVQSLGKADKHLIMLKVKGISLK
jgi:hypothetical protein